MSTSRVTRSQAVLLSAHVGRLALFVAITALLGRRLAPADFAFVALVTSLFVVSLEFLDMGTSAVATREVAAHPAAERDMLGALLALRRLLAAVLLAGTLALAASNYLDTSVQRLVMAVAAIGLFLLHLHAYQVVFQVRQAYGPVVALGLAGQAAFLAASVTAIKLHWGGAAIALLVVVRESFVALGSRRLATGMLGYRVRAPWRHPGAVPLLKAGWMLGIAGVCYKLGAYAGGFFLWGLASPEALATFSAAQRLLVPLGDMAWLFVIPLIAAMSVSATHDAAAFRLQLQGYAKLLLGLAVLAAAAGYFLAPTALAILYGEQYVTGPLSSIAAFRWLAVGYVFVIVTPVLAVGELAQGHGLALMATAFAYLALNAVLNVVTIPSRGAEGSAIALCAAEAFGFVVLLVRGIGRSQLRLDWTWAAYLLPGALLAALLGLLEGSAMLQVIVAAVFTPAALLGLLRMPAQKACRESLKDAARAPQPVLSPAADAR